MPFEPRRIETKAGTLEIDPVPMSVLLAVARYWPMELVLYADHPEFAGLVFQHGGEEVHGVKLQTADMPMGHARLVHMVSRVHIASALPAYLAKGHRGVMVPCAYYKEKGPGRFEAGFAFFVGPDAASAARFGDATFDAKLGAGATAMIADMSAAVVGAIQASGLPFPPFIGCDVRPRLALGGLSMQFLVEGPRVVVVSDRVIPDEPVWASAVEAGFTRLPYAPMKPAGFEGPLPANLQHI